MPGSEEASESWEPLSAFQVDDWLIIRRIHEFLESDRDLMKYLEINNVVPGSTAAITEIMPFNKTMKLKIADLSVILGFDIANNIYVEKIKG